jgi:hypothetical protein
MGRAKQPYIMLLLTISQTELDRYIDPPPPAKKIKTLEYWKIMTQIFPVLSIWYAIHWLYLQLGPELNVCSAEAGG